MTLPHNTFESQLTELDTLVQSLENNVLPLHEALEKFEKGIQLSRDCQQKLREAQGKMNQLLAEYDIPLEQVDA